MTRLPKRSSRPGKAGVRIAVVGRPNVGKSSFVNRLVKEDRLIVDEKPGTTRDSIDTTLRVDGKRIVLVDTAGLRKRVRVRESIEYFSTIRTTRSIQESGAVILITDATEGPTKQDKRIAVTSKEYGRCLVIAVNKIDLLSDGERDRLPQLYRRQFVFVPYAHIVLTSALVGTGLENALGLAIQSVVEAKKRIQQKRLEKAVEEAVQRYKPPSHRGKWVRIYGCEQKGVSPPRFLLYTNYPRGVGSNYIRYIEKNMRRAFGFAGTPVRILPTARR
jgi:GTP-binding protein